MCGICGFTGESNRIVLQKMADIISHRGPDEEGFYLSEEINLASRRLSIVDITDGKQPMCNEDKTIWTVFNGEIYNFIDLRIELERNGHTFYSDHSDTEVIVHLYEQYGVEFVNKINGMFAIAIYDTNKKELILARDRIGVKPLFYTIVDNNLIFSSEIKSILEHPKIKKEMDIKSINHYFSFKNIPSPMTAFKNIYSLLPGEMIFYRDKIFKKKRYWKINFSTIHKYTEEDACNIIFKLLEDAVKIRMVSDVPIGAYLSGGVDSSSVVALMSRFSERPVKTFSLGYETKLENKEQDRIYARKVSEYYHTEHFEYIMKSKEIPENIDSVIRSFDQPFSGVTSTFFLSKLISKHVKVALSGDGADELFGSYLAHRLAQPMYHYTELYPRLRLGLLNDNEKLLLSPFENNIDYLENLYSISKGDMKKWRYSLYTFSDNDKTNLFSSNYLESLDYESSFDIIKGHFNNSTANDPLNQALELDWNTLLPDQVLAFVDFLSMAHSVEVRSPFLDYRLAEFVATLPGDMKIHRGCVKDILKKSVSKILPEGIINRPKEGFVLPIFNWLENELKEYVLETLSSYNLKKHGLFDTDYVNSMVMDYYNGKHKNAVKIWNVMMFQVWWNNYFDK